MPNPPRFTLPPALFARVEALRAAAHPAPPSRQAVVEAALGRGLACLEGGPGPTAVAVQALLAALPRCWRPGCGRPATRCNARVDDLTCDDCDTGYRLDPETVDLGYAEALRALQAARGGTEGREGVGRAGDAPRGRVGPAVASAAGAR